MSALSLSWTSLAATTIVHGRYEGAQADAHFELSNPPRSGPEIGTSDEAKWRYLIRLCVSACTTCVILSDTCPSQSWPITCLPPECVLDKLLEKGSRRTSRVCMVAEIANYVTLCSYFCPGLSSIRRHTLSGEV